MSNGAWCARLGRTETGIVFIEDLKVEDPFVRRLSARTLPEAEYEDRLDDVKASGDARFLFDSKEQYRGYSVGEMGAIAVYGAQHLLDVDKLVSRPVVAYESLRTLGQTVVAHEEIAHLNRHGVELLPPHLDNQLELPSGAVDLARV